MQHVSITHAAVQSGVPATEIAAWAKHGWIITHGKGATRTVAHESVIARRDMLAGHVLPKRLPQPIVVPTKLTSVDLCAGAGGLTLGMEYAGITTVCTVDNNPVTVATIRANRPAWHSRHASCGATDLTDYAGAIDIVTAGFPCQPFSYAGTGDGFADTRGTVFFGILQQIVQLRPRFVLCENVLGLTSHDTGRTLQTICCQLAATGYTVTTQHVHAHWYGVPQTRSRLIIVGVRNDIHRIPQMPAADPVIRPVSVALADCPSSPGMTYSAAAHHLFTHVPEGGNWRDLPPVLQEAILGNSRRTSGGMTGIGRRLRMDAPSPTLTCSPVQRFTGRCHPHETRPLTVREYARIQTFPDTWTFAGSLADQYRQIGNAVPVQLAYQLGIMLVQMHTADCEDSA